MRTDFEARGTLREAIGGRTAARKVEGETRAGTPGAVRTVAGGARGAGRP